MIMLVLALFSILLIFFWTPASERMTNSDVAKKHEFHANKPTSWDMKPPKPTKKKSSSHSENQVYGPKITPIDPNEPQPTVPTTGPGSNGANSVYPQIYGPDDIKEAPGEKDRKTDSSLLLPYDYVPAAEFPAGPSEPAPFLNDFSRLLKT